ncbi:MAG: response regulator [candidate division Zixibacteria bacterium]|jgi:CheY-like chemotaxis protein|nr:response regulator [candidate division Zixibacteria bacterium]
MSGTLKKILVVDDQPEVANQICAYLEHLGFPAVAVNSVEAAIIVFKPELFELVICDVLMPGKNGFDMVQYIRNDYPETPVVLISGYFDQHMKEYQKVLNIDVIYQKPVFLKTIKQILNDALMLNLK